MIGEVKDDCLICEGQGMWLIDDVVDMIGAWTLALMQVHVSAFAKSPRSTLSDSRQSYPTLSVPSTKLLPQLALQPHTYFTMAGKAPLIVPAIKRHTATVIVAHGLGDSGAGW